MKNFQDVLGLVSGIGCLIPGSIFLFLWYRDPKHPDQKKLGYGFLVVGVLLIFARFMGWS